MGREERSSSFRTTPPEGQSRGSSPASYPPKPELFPAVTLPLTCEHLSRDKFVSSFMWVHSPSWREEAKNTAGCKSDPAGRGQLWRGRGWKGRPSFPGSSSAFQSKAFALKTQLSLGRASDTSAVMTGREALRGPRRLLSVPWPRRAHLHPRAGRLGALFLTSRTDPDTALRRAGCWLKCPNQSGLP